MRHSERSLIWIITLGLTSYLVESEALLERFETRGEQISLDTVGIYLLMLKNGAANAALLSFPNKFEFERRMAQSEIEGKVEKITSNTYNEIPLEP